MALKWVFRGFEALENVQDVVERTNGSTQCAERTKYDLVVALRNWQGAVRHKSLKPFLLFVYDRKNTKKKLADAFITNVLAEAAKQGKLELEFEQVDIDGDDSGVSVGRGTRKRTSEQPRPSPLKKNDVSGVADSSKFLSIFI